MTAEVLNELLIGALGTVLGALGGAYGATAALRDKVASHGDRLIRVETRVGLNADGSLTGNGLIGRVETLEGRVA